MCERAHMRRGDSSLTLWVWGLKAGGRACATVLLLTGPYYRPVIEICMLDININFISTHSHFYIITRLYNQEENFWLKVIPVGSLHKSISLKLEYANSNTEKSIIT